MVFYLAVIYPDTHYVSANAGQRDWQMMRVGRVFFVWFLRPNRSVGNRPGVVGASGESSGSTKKILLKGCPVEVVCTRVQRY